MFSCLSVNGYVDAEGLFLFLGGHRAHVDATESTASNEAASGGAQRLLTAEDLLESPRFLGYFVFGSTLKYFFATENTKDTEIT